MNWKLIIFIFYVIPMSMCLLYFVLIKIRDRYKQDKVYMEDKFLFIKTIISSIFPVVNIIVFIICFISIVKYKKLNSWEGDINE